MGKFKDGDRVRITQGGVPGYGGVGTLRNDPKGVYPYQVEGIYDSVPIGVLETEIEKVETGLRFSIGDRVRAVETGGGAYVEVGDTGTVAEIDSSTASFTGRHLVRVNWDKSGKTFGLFHYRLEKIEDSPGPTNNDPVDLVNHPPHYKFSNGASVIDITENLTFNGGNAVKYVARATRQDGQNKGNVLEDLRKARWYIDREIERIESEQG